MGLVSAEDVIRGVNRLTLAFSVGHWKRTVRRAWAAKTAPVPPGTFPVRCHEIMPSDLEGIIDLLTVGYEHNRTREYWVRTIGRMAVHPTPPGFPQYGVMLESNGVPVGVLLMICTMIDGVVRCNESSYYVAEPYRCYAPVMVKRAHRFKNATYLNITPSRHTWPMLEAQGYKRLCDGFYFALPLLCRPLPGVSVGDCARLEPFESELLAAHASYGCIALVCEHQGIAYPFVFAIRHKYGVRLAHLVYCRNQIDFRLVAGAVGRALVKRGILAVLLDADGPINLPGKYFEMPKYWMGAERPRQGDLAYTELAMLGEF